MCDERGDGQAAELYARAIENHDCVADAFCNLGILESKKGSTAKAFDCFTTSLKHDPRHSEAHYPTAREGEEDNSGPFVLQHDARPRPRGLRRPNTPSRVCRRRRAVGIAAEGVT